MLARHPFQLAYDPTDLRPRPGARRHPRAASPRPPRAAGRDPADVTLVAVSKQQPWETDRAGAGRRPARVRREPGAGGAWPAGPDARASRPRAAPDRPAADQQGARGGRLLRRDRDPRPRPQLARGPGRGDRRSRAARRASISRSTPARSRRRPASRRPRPTPSSPPAAATYGLHDRGADVHPARRTRRRRCISPCWPRSPRATAWRGCRWA